MKALEKTKSLPPSASKSVKPFGRKTDFNGDWRGVKWNLGNLFHFGSILRKVVMVLSERKDRINRKEMGC